MTKPKIKSVNEERLEQHRKESQLAQAERSLQLIARANLAILRDMQESGELDKLPPAPVADLSDRDVVPRPSRRERLSATPSSMRQTPQADGSDVYAFEGGHAFALITHQGYIAYRIPKDEDHILMIPGKTYYLYDDSGARIPAWRVTLSTEYRKLLPVFESARDLVNAELYAQEQADRQGKAA